MSSRAWAALPATSAATFVEWEFIDTVVGIPDSRTQIVMLRPLEGGAGGRWPMCAGRRGIVVSLTERID